MNNPADYAQALIPTFPSNMYISRVDAAESISSMTYIDLATVGPTVTVTTGTSALVIFSSNQAWAGSGFNFYASVAVTGATTVAASDGTGATMSSEGNQFSDHFMATYKFTGLTPGSNTFTLKYRVNGQTWSCSRRQLIVVVL